MAPLLKYLDEKLALLNASLVKENLSRYGPGQVEQGWPSVQSQMPSVPTGCWRPSGSCCYRLFCRLWAQTVTCLLTSMGASTSRWR